jgi:[ribosomal protein S5]-alanine N-acetyltransferase
MDAIYSDRLKLLPLTHQQLQLWAKSRIALEKELGLIPNVIQMDDKIRAELEDALLNTWLPGTAANPDHYHWVTNWEIILPEKNISVGGIGLAGLPDANGETMVGYGIDAKYHNCGYASEALACLLGWAFGHENLKAVVATTPPDNYPSHKVLKKNGFINIGRLDAEFIYWRRERASERELHS